MVRLSDIEPSSCCSAKNRIRQVDDEEKGRIEWSGEWYVYVRKRERER